jgi:hypothetical protein
MSYHPMTMAGLADHLSRSADEIRWKYVWEFLEEYRWEPVERRDGKREVFDHPGIRVMAASAEHVLL